MKITKEKITIQELSEMSERMFGNLVKAVVDIDREIIAVDGELHADEEKMLLENGSEQSSLWGINLYPELFNTEDFIEFDSMINLRPRLGNRSRGVDSEEIRIKILEVILKIVK